MYRSLAIAFMAAGIFAAYPTLAQDTGQQSTAPAASKTKDAKPAALPKGEYATEAEAQQHCSAGDAVVWVNPKSKAYHVQGSKDYGTTKRGAYMCEKDSVKAGFHPVKGEKKS